MANAYIINNTIIRSEGLGSQFNITHTWELDNLTTASDYILIQGLNRSHPSQTGNYSYTINFTEQNANYSGTDIPYISSQTFSTTQITNNLAADINSTFSVEFPAPCTNITDIYYQSADNSYNMNLTHNNITCNGNYATMSITLEEGTNTLLTYFNTSSTFTFKHEETLAVIDDKNMTLEIIGDNYPYAKNFSTTNGIINVKLPSPASYTLRYSSTDNYYQERFYFLELSDDENANVTLYSNANTTLTQITVVILDQNSDFVEDATVQLYRYDLSTNSYLLVEEGKTNFEGETKLRVALGVEFYKFLIYYDGKLKKETSPVYIYETTLTIYISTADTIGKRFEETENIDHDLVYQDGANRFKLTYSDSDNNINRMCLDVYTVSSSAKSLYNQSCSTATGGILYVSVQNVSGRTYLAKAEALLDDGSATVAQLYHKFETAGQELFGKSGLFLLLILTVTAAGLGAAFKSSFAVILAPIPLLILSALGVLTFSTGIALGLVVMGLIIGGLMQSGENN